MSDTQTVTTVIMVVAAAAVWITMGVLAWRRRRRPGRHRLTQGW